MSQLKARHTEDSIAEVGIDEAGRGCLWGPLVAAAVIWPAENSWSTEVRALSTQIKDSKQLTPKKRGSLETFIKQTAVSWAVGYVEATEIDSIGMTKANRLAFQRALEGLAVKPGRILIDGILGLSSDVIGTAEQIVEPKGDGTYLAIAAASILAKEARDRMVKELCAADPSLDEKYGILSSKGYGTAKHRAGVKEHGMHSQHRRLFLRKLLGIDHVCEQAGRTTTLEFLED